MCYLHTSHDRIYQKDAWHCYHFDILRAVAAIVILNTHFVQAFYPTCSIYHVSDSCLIVAGSPLYAPFNGEPFLVLFFTLSGFLVARFETTRINPRWLAIYALFRWLRLALPATIVTSLSYGLFSLGMYGHEAAGILAASDWLRTFANAKHNGYFSPSIGDALFDGMLRTFLFPNSLYDPPLWALRYIFLGNVFCLIYVYIYKLTGFYLTAIATLFLPLYWFPRFHPLFYCFFAGAFCCIVWDRYRDEIKALASHTITKVMFFIIALPGLSFVEPIGFYSFVNLLHISHMDWLRNILYTTISFFLVLLCLSVTDRFNNRVKSILVFMGRLAFSVYLVHVLVLCSIASVIFTALADEPLIVTLSVTYLCTLIATIIVSVVVATIDVRLSVILRVPRNYLARLCGI